MVELVKEDLVGLYKWDGQPTYSGEATRRLFDPGNGHQVLFIINLALKENVSPTLENGKNIELMIIRHLPGNMKSEITVLNWLKSEELKQLAGK